MLTSEQIEQERHTFEVWLAKQDILDSIPDIAAYKDGRYKLLRGLFITWLARAEQATADTVRLDWLADPDNHIGNVQLPSHCVEANIHNMRAAIDCAMELSNTETDGHTDQTPT